MGLSDKLTEHKKRLRGGYSIRDWVPPRQGPFGLELHMPPPFPSNFMGPRTDIKRRLAEKVKPLTHTDAAARQHDISYFNINQQLKGKSISKAQAWQKVKVADNALMRSAAYNKIAINPVEHAHANIALAGIAGKRLGQAVGLIPELAFVETSEPYDGELSGGRKKKKKKDPVGGLRKRFKKLKVRG